MAISKKGATLCADIREAIIFSIMDAEFSILFVRAMVQDARLGTAILQTVEDHSCIGKLQLRKEDRAFGRELRELLQLLRCGLHPVWRVSSMARS
jgi:hypothetical protein